MARIVVIGGGFGGLASALRLAKVGHEVTLVESSSTLGGAMRTVSKNGFTWDVGPTSTLLPAVVRDLFRKTGRPIEREVDLVQLDPATQHRFLDGSGVSVPGGTRVDQVAAFDHLGPGLGRVWSEHVSAYAETWDLLRRDYLERPYDEALAPRELRQLFDSRESLEARLRASLPDPRLRAVASFQARFEGHDPRRVPAWVGVDAYLCQRFGAWTVRGGFDVLTQALSRRLATRGVTTLTDNRVRDLVVRRGVVASVATDRGEIDCDAIVCAIDPRHLPVLRNHVGRVRVTMPPRRCHLVLSGAPLALAREVVFHGDPLLVMRTGEPVDGVNPVSLLIRGDGDPVEVLASRGLDVRDRVLTRLDQDHDATDSAYAVEWRGRGTVRRRLGPTTPITGVYAAGALANPGAGIPWVGLSAALVAQAIGPSTGQVVGPT